MHEIKVGDDAAMGAEAVWAVIGDFSGIRKWAGALEAESTEVTPKGKVRTLTMPGGRTIQELMTDEGPWHYTYTLDRADMTHYASTVSVVPVDDASCRIELVLDYEPGEGVDMTEATDGFLKFLGGNLKAMKRAVAAANA